MSEMHDPPINRLQLLDWLLPACEPDRVALLYPKGTRGLSPGWVLSQADAERAVAAYRAGTLMQETFQSRTKDGTAYEIQGAVRLGLVPHRDGVVRIFCVDLDNHSGDGGTVHLAEPMQRFLCARPITFTSKSGGGLHGFHLLAQPLAVTEFVTWARGWGFNREGEIEVFPKTAKNTQAWLPNEPNEKGGDAYVSGKFHSCVVPELPKPPSARLTNATLHFLRGFVRQPGRNEALNKAAYELAGKRMSRAEAWESCQRGARLCGLDQEEPQQTKATFDSGFGAGSAAKQTTGAIGVVRVTDQACLDRRATLLSDIGNAARLIKHHGNDIRYCHSFARWYSWNQTHWRADDQGRIVELCKQTALSIYDEAKRADGEAQKAITRWGLTSQRRDRLTAMAALAQPDVAVTPDELDADGWLLNCTNGTIDLRSGKRQPHRRADLITRVLQVEFVPDAQCPQFERFLQETFRGDQDLIRHVQNWHGHCLTSDIREQFLYVYLGGGANGKSVLLDTICEVMGLYAAEAPPDLLTLRKHPEHPTEIADLCGRRLVIASETEKEAVLRLQLIKRLTGNARLKGRWMRQDYFEFPRTHKTILVTNNPPLIPEHTEAAERRLRIVPFAYTVPEAQRDPQLLLKFRAEHPGILAWLVRGCLQWQVEGLPRVAAMNAAKRRLLGEVNSLECFIRERCVLGEREECEAAELHAEYDGWCRIHGRRTLNATEISAVLRRHQCEDGKSRGRRCWFGIGLLPADSGRDGRNGRRFPIEPQCAFHEGVNGKVASNASNASNHTPSKSLHGVHSTARDGFGKPTQSKDA